MTIAAESQTRPRERRRSFAAAKAGLAAATVIALLSLGGLMMFAFPMLVLGHLWAFRRSRVAERSLWFVLAAASAAEWAWEITYPSAGGSSPRQWIVASVAVALTASVFAIVGRRSRASAS